jgi:hypothetical protein
MLSNLTGLQKFQKLIRNEDHEEPHKMKASPRDTEHEQRKRSPAADTTPT